MNSADKLRDTGDGNLLGMTKDVIAGLEETWSDSDARDEAGNEQGRARPLDNRIGVGQLNMRRALNQFSSGKVSPPAGAGTVPRVGWDYNSLNGQGQFQRYRLPPLKAGSHIAITLTWDRPVDLLDQGLPGDNDIYDDTDDFQVNAMANLDLFLMPSMPAGAVATAADTENRWSSISTLYNLEHIFFRLPAEGGDVPHDLTEGEEEHGQFLQSKTPREELATFLMERAFCWRESGRHRKVVEAMAWASALAPKNIFYKHTLAKALNTWSEALEARRPPLFPLLRIRCAERRFPETLPFGTELDFLGLQAMENLLNTPEQDAQWWGPLRRGEPVFDVPTEALVDFEAGSCHVRFGPSVCFSFNVSR